MTTALQTKTVEVQIRAHPDEIEPAWQTRLGTTWQVRTEHAMGAVLAPGYFDEVLGHGLRVDDRIEAVSRATTPATHATLAIDEIRNAGHPGDPRTVVRALAIYKGGTK